MGTKSNKSISIAILWMLLISIVLFWLPLFGPLIAGVVGGKKAGSVGAAIIAVFLPAIIIGGAFFALASLLTGIPGIGLVAGLGGLTLALVNVGPLLLGAIIGGILSNNPPQ